MLIDIHSLMSYICRSLDRSVTTCLRSLKTPQPVIFVILYWTLRGHLDSKGYCIYQLELKVANGPSCVFLLFFE